MHVNIQIGHNQLCTEVHQSNASYHGDSGGTFTIVTMSLSSAYFVMVHYLVA